MSFTFTTLRTLLANVCSYLTVLYALNVTFQQEGYLPPLRNRVSAFVVDPVKIFLTSSLIIT